MASFEHNVFNVSKTFCVYRVSALDQTNTILKVTGISKPIFTKASAKSRPLWLLLPCQAASFSPECQPGFIRDFGGRYSEGSHINFGVIVWKCQREADRKDTEYHNLKPEH